MKQQFVSSPPRSHGKLQNLSTGVYLSWLEIVVAALIAAAFFTLFTTIL